MYFLLLASSAACVFCIYRGLKLSYIDLFLLRDALYVLELQSLSGTLSSPQETERARAEMNAKKLEKNLYYAGGFAALAVSLVCFLVCFLNAVQ